MSYDKKLLEEWRKYKLVTCPICKKRKTKDWNIYKANATCSPECARKLIEKLLNN